MGRIPGVARHGAEGLSCYERRGSVCGPSAERRVEELLVARVALSWMDACGMDARYAQAVKDSASWERIREIRAYAARNGTEIVAEYQEAASAFQREGKRVGFHRMVARAKAMLNEIDAKIPNIRWLIEDGLADVRWASERLAQLSARHTELASALQSAQDPPRVDSETVAQYVGRVKEITAVADPATGKELVRTLVQDVKLAPDEREVTITYRLPEPAMNGVVAGACYSSLERYCRPDNLHWRYTSGQRHLAPEIVA